MTIQEGSNCRTNAAAITASRPQLLGQTLLLSNVVSEEKSNFALNPPKSPATCHIGTTVVTIGGG
jgi:hypothetical protein